jgi:co-chaperonin GroES (HSP10)
MKLQGKTLLIKPENIAMTSGGIHLTPLAKKVPIGMVVDTGPGCKEVKTGDRVHYNPKKSNRMQVDGTEMHFVPEGDIAYIY